MMHVVHVTPTAHGYACCSCNPYCACTHRVMRVVYVANPCACTHRVVRVVHVTPTTHAHTGLCVLFM